MNSSVAFWPSAAFADVGAVRTTIPSCAVSVQPAWSFGDALDLDEAHAAGADGRPEPRLVAEDRDLDPGRGGRLDEPRALRRPRPATVDRPTSLDPAPSGSTDARSLGPRSHARRLRLTASRRLGDVVRVLVDRREDVLERRLAAATGSRRRGARWNSSRNLSM